jgi:hypothetical protein
VIVCFVGVEGCFGLVGLLLDRPYYQESFFDCLGYTAAFEL